MNRASTDAPISSAQRLEIHASTGLRTDDSNMLLPSPILRVFEEIGPKLDLLLLQPTDLLPDVGQSVCWMSVLRIATSTMILRRRKKKRR